LLREGETTVLFLAGQKAPEKERCFMQAIEELAKQLRQEGHAFLKAADALENIHGNHNGKRPLVRAKRRLSVAGRRRIAAAQRARWAKIRGTKRAA
jgi:hypothetical protein